LKNALDALTISAVPYAAGQIHATAAELHRLRGDVPLAEHHRGFAAAIVRRLADSFPDREELRETLLGRCSELEADSASRTYFFNPKA